MAALHVEESRVINAPPDVVYGIIADYRTEHARILPRPAFDDPIIEQGGYGAGTVFRVTTHVLGSTTSVRMTVTEPEPGRVLMEEDAAAGVKTTFSVTPQDGGARSLVTIATVWQPKPGIAGRIEGWIVPRAARRLYQKELGMLDAYAQSKRGAS